MESNDSPEIPDRGKTTDITGLPSVETERNKGRLREAYRDRQRENSVRDKDGETEADSHERLKDTETDR